MKQIKRVLALMIAFTMVFALSSCGRTEEDTGKAENTDTVQDKINDDDKNSGTDTNTDDEKKEDQPAENPLKVGFLKGPTGMGAAYFIEQNENGVLGEKYDITVEAEVTNINSALISGSLDIAAVPTNTAAILYNKTGGNIRMAAINTRGVLYILENGDSIHSVADLAGKTVYATGQGANPQYVLEYILSQNGLTVGESVFVEYMASDELTTQMAAGMVDIAMLPVPAVTTVLAKNESVRIALSLSDEWDSVTRGKSVLTQGCIVARSDTVTDEELKAFLSDYEVSVNYMNNDANIDSAAELAVKHGIVGAVPIAKKAIPDCNMVFESDPDNMREYLTDYYQILYAADPTSIGGSVPDDAFYR